MADPVSWFLIERGWRVVAEDGTELGTVAATVGDPERDIFDGLTVGTGLLSKPRYVPAEQVAEIVEGTVRLSLDKGGFDRLRDEEPPPRSTPVRPE